MKITLEKVDDLASLARLSFKGEEKETMRQDLEKILEMCQSLNQVDTDGVEPLIYMSGEVNVVREDNVLPDLTKEQALKNAPKKDSDFFRVPKVIEGQ